MKKISRTEFYFIAMAGIAMLNGTPAWPQQQPLEDWPCAQAYVSEIAYQVIWSGPDPTALPIELVKGKDIDGYAQRLTRRHISEGEIESILDEFNAEETTFDHNQRLTALFSAALTRLNHRRRDYLLGIRKYARHQDALAGKIEMQLNEHAELEGKTDQASITRSKELEQTLHWSQRMFHQREASIGTLCEQPIQIEEQAGQLARAIQQRLE